MKHGHRGERIQYNNQDTGPSDFGDSEMRDVSVVFEQPGRIATYHTGLGSSDSSRVTTQ